MKYSTIIKNGTIFDGLGNTPFRADVALNKEKIVEIENLDKAKAKKIIDATGLYITPGFIDLTTHSDNHWTLFSQPSQKSFIRQGITTILGGHGGASLAPIIKEEALDPLSKWVDLAKINVNWRTTEEFLNQLEKHPLGLNFATLTGHETLRRNILGNKTGEARVEEIKEINSLLENSLEEGSFGLSSNLGRYFTQKTSERELLTLFETVAQHNAFSAHHLKDEGKNLLPTVSHLIMLLRGSKSRGHIAHFKALGRGAWESFTKVLKMIEIVRREDIVLTCDFFPYTNTGSNLMSLLPPWALSENKEDILKFLKKSRQDIIDYLKSLTLHYDKIVIASTTRNIGSVGKNIQTISKESGLSPEDVIINLLEVSKLRVSIFNDVISEKNIEVLSEKPYSMVTSDGVGLDIVSSKIDLPHPRSFGAFPKALNEFVKTKKIIDWETAIYKMTGLPATTLGLKDRGILKKKNYADIVVFDPGTIKDMATYEKPWQYAKGIEYVFINGALVLDKDSLVEKPAGKILRKNGG